jgi:hypothetical protein
MGNSPVINRIKDFAKEAAIFALKAAAKGATSFVLGKVPIVGSMAADYLNSKYARGGKVCNFADGGMVKKLEAKGLKTQEIKSEADIIKAIKQFPEAAQKAGLSVQDIKDAKEEAKADAPASAPEAPQMKRGGKSGRVVEVADDMNIQRTKAPKKRQHKKRMAMAQEEPAFRSGGLMDGLPENNLDRLVPAHARGGMPDTDSQSYVQLKKGYAPMSHQGYSKKMC